MKTISNVFKKFTRSDSWVNNSTNLGVSSSRTNNTFYRPNLVLPKQILEGLYNDDGISQRIVETVVADSLKGFINAEIELLEEMKRIKAKQKIFEVGSFGRLYGGALLVAFVDDGEDMSKPLNHDRIHELASLQVFDRHQVSFEEEDICHDIYDNHYGEPEIFTIGKQGNSYLRGEYNGIRVHRSRCFVFGGKNLSNTAKVRNQGWDGSVLQACYNSIRNHAIINNSSVEIVQDFVQPILKVSGLGDKISNDEINAVRERLEIIDRSRSSQNTIMLDSEGGEEYTKLPSNVSGLSELWEQFSETLCATTGIPASRLFGRAPSGLNASGENDQKNWHDIVSSYREDQIEPCLTWLISILEKQQNWKTKANDFNWTFPELNSPSEAQLAEIKKKYAEIDAIYIDRGGISASRAWQERFGSGQFQRDIKLDEAELDGLDIEETEEEETEIKFN